MGSNFKKILYDNRQGYSLHHTVGAEASESTLDRPHCHINYMLIHFIHGTGNIKIEGRQYPIEEGDIILLNPMELFHCQVDRDTYHERIVLYIGQSLCERFPGASEDLLLPFTNREKGVGNRIPAQTVRSVGLDKLLHVLLTLCQSPTTASKLLSLCKVVELMIQLQQTTVSTIQNRINNHDSPLIDDILVYINDNYTQNISIDAIANTFSIHKSYLSHLFTDQVGMSLWNYVILRRLNAFNELVRHGRAIEDACYQVGFQNYSNFFRLYKKHTGMTPMQFKKHLVEK